MPSMNQVVPAVEVSFQSLGVDPAILKILESRQLNSPTPIQHRAIPAALEGKDLIGIAQTGTGKTWAFGIPLLQRLKTHGGRALIVVPTRELASQVEGSLMQFARAMGIGTAVFVGGAPMGKQRQMLKMNPRLLIATPGRLNDHLEQGTVTLREVKVLVLDEADRMLDMGFKPQIEKILRNVPKERQTLLFSATMPSEIGKLALHHMKLPITVEVAPAGTTAKDIEQELFVVKKEEKIRLLEKLLEEDVKKVLVFSRTKHGAKKMTKMLQDMGHTASEIHSNKSLSQRKEALEGFRIGRYRVLVATDIAARGIHVTGIDMVINFDMPDDPGDYVHRIGRTARAGTKGRAVTFASPDQLSGVKSIERLIRATLPRKPVPALPPARAKSAEVSFDDRPRTPYRGGFSRGGSGGSRRPVHKRKY